MKDDMSKQLKAGIDFHEKILDVPDSEEFKPKDQEIDAKEIVRRFHNFKESEIKAMSYHEPRTLSRLLFKANKYAVKISERLSLDVIGGDSDDITFPPVTSGSRIDTIFCDKSGLNIDVVRGEEVDSA